MLFHLVWIDPNGKSIYKKKEMLTKAQPKINTQISISPELRKSGVYRLNVYLYRVLLFSKEFHLLPPIKSEKESLILSTRVNRKTTELQKEHIIPLMDDKWLKATVNLKHKPFVKQDLLYQFNWMDNENHVFYKKEIIVDSDTINTITCSLQINPNKRKTGSYKVQALLFGELIAEEGFELTKPLNASKITATGNVYKKSKRRNKSTHFTLGNKNKIFTVFDINNANTFGNQELNFKMVWLDKTNNPIYTKRINTVFKSAKQTIKSAISANPNKRKTGSYKVQLYLFNKLISETSFTLEKEVVRKKMTTSIILYHKFDKKTKTRVATSFKLNKNSKVHALIKINNPEMYGKTTKLKFRIAWIGINNKKFYAKNIELTPLEAVDGIKSAISISPLKRKAGNYKIKLYLFNKLINEKLFVLEP